MHLILWRQLNNHTIEIGLDLMAVLAFESLMHMCEVELLKHHF